MNDFFVVIFLILASILSIFGLIGAIINIPKGISRSIRNADDN